MSHTWGQYVIDPYHQLSGVKWLREKPLSKFVDAQWLLIQKAEEEKLLKVTVKLPEDAKKKLMSEARENYLSDCVSKSAQLWDEQRKMILDDAFFNFLLPSMEKETWSVLTAKTEHCHHMECGKQLPNKVTVARWMKKMLTLIWIWIRVENYGLLPGSWEANNLCNRSIRGFYQ